MTSSSATLQPAAESADTAAPAPSAWRAFAAAFVLSLVAGLALVAGAVSGYAASYDGRILAGVHVGSVDLSGLDRERAAAVLGAAYGAYGDGRVVVDAAAGDVSISYGDVGRRLDVEALVSAAMNVGRDGSDLQRALAVVRVAAQGAVIQPQLTLDEDALATGVAAGLARLERKPTDATIAMGPRGVMTTPARQGWRFDVAAAQAAALEGVRRLDAPAEIVIEAPSIEVPPSRGDAVVRAARERAERMIANVVVTSGSKKWTIKAATVRRWLAFESGPEESLRPTIVRSRVGPALKAVAKGVRRKPVSARFLVSKSGKTFGAQAGSSGRQLDLAGTTAAIATELALRAGGAEPGRVRAAVVAVEPKLTTEEARKAAPLMSLLGAWTTRFPIGDRNFWGRNIWLPARYINGTVLKPGHTFEWFSAVGPVTPARGFGPGGVINGNHSEPTGAMGGGMCSSSTTLFNAALRAGLKMGARSNHIYYIDRYPLGLDATVWIMGGGRQTVTFTNDMAHPIYIRGVRLVGRGGQGYVRYEIWGVPDGRRVSIGAPVVRNVLRATTKTVYVTTLRPGVRKQTEWPANGMDVWVTRVVRDRGGHVIHAETYYSHYRLWNGRIEVGARRT
jgi:vancomycin resistance protein YoaR